MHGFVLNSYATGQNSLSTRKSKKKHGFLKIPDTPTKTRWSRAQFRKGQPTHCKSMHAFVYSFWQALDWGLLSKIQASMLQGNWKSP